MYRWEEESFSQLWLDGITGEVTQGDIRVHREAGDTTGEVGEGLCKRGGFAQHSIISLLSICLSAARHPLAGSPYISSRWKETRSNCEAVGFLRRGSWGLHRLRGRDKGNEEKEAGVVANQTEENRGRLKIDWGYAGRRARPEKEGEPRQSMPLPTLTQFFISQPHQIDK